MALAQPWDIDASHFILSGVKLGFGYARKDNSLFGKNGLLPIHTFIIIDGKGWGLFAAGKEHGNLSPFDHASVRDNDLQIYPVHGKGEFYSLTATVRIDPRIIDKKKFQQGVRDYIAKVKANPGMYVILSRDCAQFVDGAVAAGVMKGKMPGVSYVKAVWSGTWVTDDE